MSYEEVEEYDNRGILSGSIQSGLYWRAMNGVIYERATDQAIAARFTTEGWIYAPEMNQHAQLVHHLGYTAQLLSFGPPTPVKTLSDQPLANVDDISLSQTLGELAW